MADTPQIQSPVNPQVTVTGAPLDAPVQHPVQHPEQLVKMWAPDAKPGDMPEDVYAEKVHDAVLAGGVVAVPFVAPDGSKDYVALHKVPDAIRAGGHIDDKVINSLSDNSGVTGVGSGIAKGAVDTMRGTANTMGGEGTAERIGIPDVSTAPSGLSEKIGKGAESVLEFMLGEEALKGLSLGEKLEKIAPAVKAMEAHPNLAKVLGSALRGAAIGGGQGAVKAEGQGQDVLKGAGFGALAGAAGGAIAEAIPGGAIKDALSEPESAPGIVSSILKGKEAAEPMANRAMRLVSPWARQAEASKSLMTQLEPSIGNVLSDAKASYAALDDAAGTNVKKLYDDMDFFDDKVRDSVPGSPEEAKWENARNETLKSIEDAKTAITDKMGKNGMKILDKADKLYTRAQALKDVQKNIFQNPSIIHGDVRFGTPETVDVDAAINALKKLQFNTKYGAPRLEQALGKSGADELMNDLYAAQRAGVKALSKQRFAKILGTLSGGALLYHAGEFVHSAVNAIR